MHLEKIALHSWKVRREGLVTHTNFLSQEVLWFSMFKTNTEQLLLSAVAKAAHNCSAHLHCMHVCR